jgi:hypothetical protein
LQNFIRQISAAAIDPTEVADWHDYKSTIAPDSRGGASDLDGFIDVPEIMERMSRSAL